MQKVKCYKRDGMQGGIHSIFYFLKEKITLINKWSISMNELSINDIRPCTVKQQRNVSIV